MIKIDARRISDGVAVSVMISGDGRSVRQEISHCPAALLTNFEECLRTHGISEHEIQAAILESAKEIIECMCRSFDYMPEIVSGGDQ